MKPKQEIIAEVSATMKFEGMPLEKADQKRLESCVGKSQAHYKKVRKELVARFQKINLKS